MLQEQQRMVTVDRHQLLVPQVVVAQFLHQIMQKAPIYLQSETAAVRVPQAHLTQA